MLEALRSSEDVLVLNPKPQFVIKTKLAEDTVNPKRVKGTKVFLNICSDDQVPLPEVGYDPRVIYPMIMDNKWEIPIVTSQERVDKDKKGQLAFVYDCIVNTKAIRWIQMDKELKDILVEWSLESVELRSKILLSRDDIALPKLTSKGEVQELEVLRSDLDINRLNKEFERVSNLQTEPQSILEARRINEDEIDEARDQIDIFNVQSKPIDKSNESSTKPLIQEITNMSIRSPPKPKSPVERPQLKYSTTMHKIDTNGYKLKIEIKSQNDSSLDYELNLDTETNTIILKNLNPKFTTKKDLELPLPLIFTNPEIKSFFVHEDSTLVLFIK
ncbi:hypothetical protein BN7_375 [Wickerhamomyces ciferrii]|uniref:PIH1 N-terminal domain-containing protein n=1 Tax=Wickerhamomyces ciferrii (strain ATCC 14091 / BCRC 22168 / CBS 111 / JCM 3599 / NBRC 0793 / NRRL Y-1031 F-60-10) TaxID=1206466 RepID=K0KD72_WICCF|nr:uncharacterized protein BN7_375 [Wickerhamomyces ciferrii]CCH40841.1 hypothetical protein BN7_375 [Wickerhamomyces ciferrii]